MVQLNSIKMNKPTTKHKKYILKLILQLLKYKHIDIILYTTYRYLYNMFFSWHRNIKGTFKT